MRGAGAAVVVSLGLCACGFSPGSSKQPLDADVDADTPIDSPSVPTFGTPTMIALDGTGTDDDPSLTADFLQLYFNRGNDVYVATRASPTAPFGLPTYVTGASSGAVETGPEVWYDGTVMYLARLAGSDHDLYATQRSNSTWGAPVRVNVVNGQASDGAPSLSKDGLTLVFASDRDAGGVFKMYWSTRPALATNWEAPSPIPTVNTDTSSQDTNPVLTEDKLALYFNSDRDGDHDIYVATRTSTADPFGPPQLVPGINTDANEEDPWISPNGRYIVFCRDNQTLWEASR